MSKSQTPHIDELYSQLTSATIIMVDDEPVLMEVLQAFLEDKGYSNFIKVEDSRDALSVLHEERPDILLLDLNMPHVGGFEILEAVRASDVLERMPVIVLTSSSDSETKVKALELGATDFLAKPVDASELALRMRNTLTVRAYQEQLTYYDTLTQLPNRKLFIDRLDWLLTKARREQQPVAILDIGLDRFKQINDSLGPAMGDQTLKEVASRLLSSVRETDVISRTGMRELWRQMGRLGGDEFAIALTGLVTNSGAEFIASRIHKALHEKFQIEGNEFFLSASIGIAIYPEDGFEADRLMKNAGAATAYAKQQGRSQTQFYSRDINKHSQQHLNMEVSLRRAIEKDEFVLHYQPKVNAETEAITDCEALIRWQCPDRGLVNPDEFIPLAEGAGLIVPIGDWVIREACRQQVAWREQGVGDMKVSVNVAAEQFNKGNLTAVIRDALESSGMDPGRLNLEITESELMENADRFVKLLHEIRGEGPSFSIDDFGTGYSSLSYLKRFPVEELKIDKSFLTDVPASRDDAAIVRAIIAMAHSLDLKVVAEGVENTKQLDFLKSLQCELIQGYYFSKPLSADDFGALVAAHSSRSKAFTAILKESLSA